ncbi:MAG TPA: MCP four helix bundle domain-containing protein [Rhodocyclaceae bacterium]|nr:MCP four helix bundle domain-containing protein [Rhodocyclaceae bacterium]
MNLTISKRLLAMILASAAALLIVGITGLVTASHLTKAIEVANSDAIPSIVTGDDAQAAVLKVQIGLSRHILNTDDAKMESLEKSIQTARTTLSTKLNTYAKDLVSSDEDRKRIEAVQVAVKTFDESIDKALNYSRQNKDDEARKSFEEIVQPSSEVAFKALEDLSTLNGENAEAEAEAAASFSKTSRAISIGVIALSIGVIGGMGFLLVRSIGGALQRVQNTVGRIQRD